ncbi:fructose-bisphosphate aldolase [Blastopirellula marina DSM 3645]|uniref:Fructose-bisphosphate aldolase n=1 Tax=Blastopirellula marina DSM 3645 TaxID=314230 RepID=A4A1Q6_9BACT|nr:fructose-bisphosphate aldolase [Blastopirellula marina DSM 3645]
MISFDRAGPQQFLENSENAESYLKLETSSREVVPGNSRFQEKLLTCREKKRKKGEFFT